MAVTANKIPIGHEGAVCQLARDLFVRALAPSGESVEDESWQFEEPSGAEARKALEQMAGFCFDAATAFYRVQNRRVS